MPSLAQPQPSKDLSSTTLPGASERSSPNLDFLRTFAVSLVVLRHLQRVFGLHDTSFLNWQALGIAGVLIFFVHTCLVLMFSLHRQEARTGGRRLFVDFFIRRVFRIYPLSILVVVAAAALSVTFPAFTNFDDVGPPPHGWELVSNLLLIQNLTHQPNILGPLWSLPLEMQMYLLLPGLFLLAGRLSVPALVAFWCLSVVMAFVQVRYLPFLPDLLKYIPCFLPGVIAYKRWKGPRHFPFWSLPVLLILGMGAYMLVYAKVHSQTFVGMPFCLALGLGLPKFADLQNKHLAKACTVIARYSYGIYLTHAIVIWAVFDVLKGGSPFLQWLLFLVGLCVLPVALYHGVEAPGIRLGHRIAQRVAHGPFRSRADA